MEFLAKMKILIEMEIFDEQPKFYEINFFGKKNRICCQKSQCNICQQTFATNAILAKNRDFRQKSKFWLFFWEILKFNIKILNSGLDHICGIAE